MHEGRNVYKKVDPKTSVPSRPPFGSRLSILAGNALQLAGLCPGWALLFAAASLTSLKDLRVLLMLVGWFFVCIDCHALGHYLVGLLVKNCFLGYGVSGIDHPLDNPPALRQLMSAMLTSTVMTEKMSMVHASPPARGQMFIIIYPNTNKPFGSGLLTGSVARDLTEQVVYSLNRS